MNCPIDIIAGRLPDFEPLRCPIEYVNWLQFSLDETFYFAKQNLRKAANRQKRNYDTNSKPRHFENGNFVWRWYPPHANIKLGLGWIDPYQIVKKITDVTYRIQKSPKVRSLVVHLDHLKPYYGATAILWKEIDFSPNEENLTIVNREFEDDINAVDSTEGNVNNLDASVKYSQNDFSDGEKEFNTDFKTPVLDEHVVDAQSES